MWSQYASVGQQISMHYLVSIFLTQRRDFSRAMPKAAEAVAAKEARSELGSDSMPRALTHSLTGTIHSNQMKEKKMRNEKKKIITTTHRAIHFATHPVVAGAVIRDSADSDCLFIDVSTALNRVYMTVYVRASAFVRWLDLRVYLPRTEYTAAVVLCRDQAASQIHFS